MTDIKLVETAEGYLDLSIANGRFESVDGLQASLDVSILTDRRADESQVSDPTKSRGWMGDVINGYQIGSLLWLLEQSRETTETINKGSDYLRLALSWLIDDGLATDIDVAGDFADQGIAWTVAITTPDDGTITKTVTLWRNTIAVS